jgi:CRISPR-associated protein Cmr1
MSRDAKPPAVPEIPRLDPVPRRCARGPALSNLSLSLRTITPLLGGGAVTRRVEREGKVRVSGIRGQLRFWWRALHAHEHDAPSELARHEAALWGSMGRGSEQPKRSLVDVWVEDAEGRLDENPVKPGMPGFYALWPARGQRKGDRSIEDEAERWEPDLRFRLCVRAPSDLMEDVVRTLRAWLLFGGLGSRTRRGLGSLTVATGNFGEWLPVKPTRAELGRLLGGGVSFAADRAWEEATDTPSLHGAFLYCGKPQPSGEVAWREALGWLSDFRQGPQKVPPRPDPNLPREPPPPRDRGQPVGRSADRPGRSRWPEPDKVRLLSGKRTSWAHEIRHASETIVWPRAGFGLPIVGQFQTRDRNDQRYREPEPENFEIAWRFEGKQEPRDRLASPLIVKALPLAEDRYVPMALWLFRGHPRGAEVVLCRKGKVVDRSAAPFDVLHAEGDPVLYEPLRGKNTMREAFLDWLSKTKGIRSIEP